MTTALVLLGSNLDPELVLPRARAELAKLGQVRAVSSVWVSPPTHRPEQPDFHNQACLLATTAQPAALRTSLRAIEARLGRLRTEDPHAARPIDLDLLLWGDMVDPVGPPVLPDPDLETRAHVAVPAAEVAPTWCHPVHGLPLTVIAEGLAPGWRSGVSGNLRRLADPQGVL